MPGAVQTQVEQAPAAVGEICTEPETWRLHRYIEAVRWRRSYDGEILKKIDCPSELHNGAWMKKEVGLELKKHCRRF